MGGGERDDEPAAAAAAAAGRLSTRHRKFPPPGHLPLVMGRRRLGVRILCKFSNFVK